ncbi:hypothetical protein KDL45_13205 [bacterium]|nr:hypothetical protein [bacterium]
MLATMDGRVRGLGFADGANFQGCGVRTAQKQIESAIQAAMKAGRIGKAQVACAAYGISGADREKDFDTVAEFLAPVNPAERFVLSNDTTLALRAGTHDGVGVACIAGTGSNTMGFNAAGDHIKVGGFGGYSGDYGSSLKKKKKKVRNDKLSKYPDNSLRLLSTRKLVGVSFDVLDLRKAEELAQELDDIELQIEDKEKT